MADPADVGDFEQALAMAARAEQDWGRVDILVNNAGVLRDKTFAKMDMPDFEVVVRVHLIGSVHCTRAVWAGMRERNYGRIVLTSSASGIYGNFGQSNYGAAKAGLIGLMNVLGLEGAKNDIRVNILAPTARTAMTEGLLPPAAAELLGPETVTPGGAVSGERGRAVARHSGRRGGDLRRHPHRRDRRRLSGRRRAHARDDRGPLGRDLRPRDRQAAAQRLFPDPKIRRRRGEGEGAGDRLVRQAGFRWSSPAALFPHALDAEAGPSAV